MSELTSHPSLDEWLESQIGLAARAMREELGERSVCTVHKDGRVTGGLKYQEGRMSALAGVRRALVKSGDPGAVALAAAEQQWSAEFETRRSATTPSSLGWVSYATGGLDAVREACERWEVSLP